MSNTTQPKDEQSIRLFKSDFMEFFSHISPIAVLVIFIPLVAFFLFLAARANQAGGWWNVPISFAIGLLIWPLIEYLLHRLIFHWAPANPGEKTKRFLFLMHGVHHATPRDKTRLVMPPVLSLPLSALFYLLFWLVVGKLIGAPHYVAGIFAGFLLGYVVYDITHYALHHFSLKGNYFARLRRHHMGHHFKYHTMSFGVSTWFWDKVFKTYPRQ